jgi:hypothetical protein
MLLGAFGKNSCGKKGNIKNGFLRSRLYSDCIYGVHTCPKCKLL